MGFFISTIVSVVPADDDYGAYVLFTVPKLTVVKTDQCFLLLLNLFRTIYPDVVTFQSQDSDTGSKDGPKMSRATITIKIKWIGCNPKGILISSAGIKDYIPCYDYRLLKQNKDTPQTNYLVKPPELPASCR